MSRGETSAPTSSRLTVNGAISATSPLAWTTRSKSAVPVVTGVPPRGRARARRSRGCRSRGRVRRQAPEAGAPEHRIRVPAPRCRWCVVAETAAARPVTYLAVRDRRAGSGQRREDPARHEAGLGLGAAGVDLGDPGGSGVLGEAGEVGREPQVAGLRELERALGEAIRAARERRELPGPRGGGGRL